MIEKQHGLMSLVVTLLTALYLLPVMADEAAAPQASSYKAAREAFEAKGKKNSKGPKFSEADRAVMKKAAEDLARAMPSPGLKVGAKAPDFILNNAFGKPVGLASALKKGPVVLVFYRGAWCPFCNLHMHALQASLPKFEALGAQLIAVTPQQPDRSQAQIKKDGYPFEILSDLDSKVMKAYRLYYELSPELVVVYKRFGLDVAAFNGPGREVLPVPGTFVIDSRGVIQAVHADTDYKERMEPTAIIAALKKMAWQSRSSGWDLY